MAQITQRHLDFLENARKAFDLNIKQETYYELSKDLIALRYGTDRDCIWVYELGEEVAFFAQMIDYKSKSPEAEAYES